MALLAGSVIVIGVIGVLDLLLTFGVIRRLREHNDILTRRLGGDLGSGAGLPAVGEPVAPFTATTLDGEVVTAAGLADSTLVAVFSTSCAPCREKLPGFVAAAAAHPGGSRRVLAVVDGDGDGARTFLEALAGVAMVVSEVERGALSSALGVTAFPAFAVVDAGGIVRAVAHDPARLPVPAPR